MKIAVLVQIFETPLDTGSDRHFFFARHMVQKGHEVVVITANVDYKNAQPRFESKWGVYTRVVDGLTIKYVPVYTGFRGSFFGKLIFFVSYFICSTLEFIKLRHIDMIYAVSTPLTVGFLGSVFSRCRKIPLIFEVTDVWPEAAIQTGFLKSPLLIKIAQWMEIFCYRTAGKIVCLTQGIRAAIIERGIAAEKTELITNGVDLSLFESVSETDRIKIRHRYKIGDKINVVYMGAHGSYNSLETICQAALILRNRRDICFTLIGEGDVKASLREFAKINNLENINFIGTVTRSESVKYLASADIFVLPNRKGAFFEGNLPNKLFDYLASSRPLVVTGFGETASVVKDASAGAVVEAENPDALAQAIMDLSDIGNSARQSIGRNARAYVENCYNRIDHAENLVKIMEEQCTI
jgi:glycosyltransferase involved in cell wall biosynthesis